MQSTNQESYYIHPSFYRRDGFLRTITEEQFLLENPLPGERGGSGLHQLALISNYRDSIISITKRFIRQGMLVEMEEFLSKCETGSTPSSPSSRLPQTIIPLADSSSATSVQPGAKKSTSRGKDEIPPVVEREVITSRPPPPPPPPTLFNPTLPKRMAATRAEKLFRKQLDSESSEKVNHTNNTPEDDDVDQDAVVQKAVVAKYPVFIQGDVIPLPPAATPTSSRWAAIMESNRKRLLQQVYDQEKTQSEVSSVESSSVTKVDDIVVEDVAIPAVTPPATPTPSRWTAIIAANGKRLLQQVYEWDKKENELGSGEERPLLKKSRLLDNSFPALPAKKNIMSVSYMLN